MSVLIKGMKMPTSCSECTLNYDCFKCIVTGTPFFNHEHNFDDETTRLDNCPLVSVPSHGRLIDADEMKESIRKQTAFLRLIGGEFAEIAEMIEKGFLQEIDNAPTIIEAEEGE